MSTTPEIGTSVQAIDEDTGLWCSATVLEIKEESQDILVQYDGWKTMWNRWMKAGDISAEVKKLVNRLGKIGLGELVKKSRNEKCVPNPRCCDPTSEQTGSVSLLEYFDEDGVMCNYVLSKIRNDNDNFLHGETVLRCLEILVWDLYAVWNQNAYIRTSIPERLLTRRQPEGTLPATQSRKLRRGASVHFKLGDSIKTGEVDINDPFLGCVMLTNGTRKYYEDLVEVTAIQQITDQHQEKNELPKVTVRRKTGVKRTAPVSPKKTGRNTSDKKRQCAIQIIATGHPAPEPVAQIQELHSTQRPAPVPAAPELSAPVNEAPGLLAPVNETPGLLASIPAVPGLHAPVSSTPGLFDPAAQPFSSWCPSLWPYSALYSSALQPFVFNPALPSSSPSYLSPARSTSLPPSSPNLAPSSPSMQPSSPSLAPSSSSMQSSSPSLAPSSSSMQSSSPSLAPSSSSMQSSSTSLAPSSSSMQSSSTSLAPSSSSMQSSSTSLAPSSSSMQSSSTSLAPSSSNMQSSPTSLAPSSSSMQSSPTSLAPSSSSMQSSPPSLAPSSSSMQSSPSCLTPSSSCSPFSPSFSPLSLNFPSSSPSTTPTSPRLSPSSTDTSPRQAETRSAPTSALPQLHATQSCRIKNLEQEVFELKQELNTVKTQLHQFIRAHKNHGTTEITDSRVWNLTPHTLPAFPLSDASIRIAINKEKMTFQEIEAEAVAAATTREGLCRELFLRTFTLKEIYKRNVRGRKQPGQAEFRGAFDVVKVTSVMDTCFKRYPSANRKHDEQKCITKLNECNRNVWRKFVGVTLPSM